MSEFKNWKAYYIGGLEYISVEKLAEIVAEIVGSKNYIGCLDHKIIDAEIVNQDTRIFLSNVNYLPSSFQYRGWHARMVFENVINVPNEFDFQNALAKQLGFLIIVDAPEDKNHCCNKQIVEPNGDRWLAPDGDEDDFYLNNDRNTWEKL